jgi:leucyl-tRNA synthetase
MGVPAHDTRDMQFALQHQLPIKPVIQPPANANQPNSGTGTGTSHQSAKAVTASDVYSGEGVLVNSETFSGMTSAAATKEIINRATQLQRGGSFVAYRLRDWLISRQRYWGAPIPLVHCSKCNVVPVPAEELPVLLPPPPSTAARRDIGLAHLHDWKHTTCPKYS